MGQKQRQNLPHLRQRNGSSDICLRALVVLHQLHGRSFLWFVRIVVVLESRILLLVVMHALGGVSAGGGDEVEELISRGAVNKEGKNPNWDTGSKK